MKKRRTKHLKAWSGDGQDTIEYALVIAVVALASVVALSALAGQLTTVWNVAAAWFNRPLP